MLAVIDRVCVVTCFGGGRIVIAIFTELVGYAGVGLFAVILDPGRPCIGAYMMVPDCERNGIEKEAAGAIGSGAPAPLLATLFSVEGPVVPLTFLIPAATLGGKLPVMPVREKRGE